MDLPHTRDLLLHLHKALMDYQKTQFEQQSGLVQNPNHYYQLVLNDPSFAWLRTLSALVVSIDELLEKPEELTEQKQTEIGQYTKKLLTSTDVADTFAANYQAAVTASEPVRILHAQVLATLGQ